MTLQIIDCEQGSLDWYRARMGIPTASEFAKVMASGKDGGDSITRKDYMLKLADEILSGEPKESYDKYSNAHMEDGKTKESEARDLYLFLTGANLKQVGFIVNGKKGCSPDALVGNDGMLEIKRKLPPLLLKARIKGTFPAEHKAQCQGGLWVAEREWIDIALYWPNRPMFVKRAYRDEEYIKKLSDAVDKFNDELAKMVEEQSPFYRAAA